MLLVLHQLLAAGLPEAGVVLVVLQATDCPGMVVRHIPAPLLQLLRHSSQSADVQLQVIYDDCIFVCGKSIAATVKALGHCRQAANSMCASIAVQMHGRDMAGGRVRTLEQAAFMGKWKSMDSPISVSSSNMAARQSLDSCFRLRQATGHRLLNYRQLRVLKLKHRPSNLHGLSLSATNVK